MGRHWSKEQKRLQGQPAVLGRDVISMQATPNGVATHSKLGSQAGNGINTWRVNKKAALDALAVELESTVSSGVLSVSLTSQNKGVLASGTLQNKKGQLWTWSPDDLNAVTLPSGDVLEGAFTVSNGMSNNLGLEARVMLRYLEE